MKISNRKENKIRQYDGKDAHCRLDYKLHINTDYYMVRFSQRRMRSNSARVRIRIKEWVKNIWLMIITVRNASREIYNLGEVLCHSKFLTKQTNNSGMEMMKPLGVMGIEVNTYHDISRGLENKCHVYIG